MATFTINITENIPTYKSATTVILRDECAIHEESLDVGIDQQIPRHYLISSYVGNPWAKLVITALTYSDTSLYIGIPVTKLVTIDLTHEIDITGLTIIPNFQVVLDAIFLDVPINFIGISFYIEDDIGLQGDTVTSSLQVHTIECVTPPGEEPSISNLVPGGSNPCSSRTFTITGDNSTTYKYEIITIDDGNHSYDATLQNTDTMGFLTPDQVGGTGNSVTGNYTTNGAGIINLKYEICARVPIDPFNNEVSVKFMLYKEDGITLNTSETFTIIATYII